MEGAALVSSRRGRVGAAETRGRQSSPGDVELLEAELKTAKPGTQIQRSSRRVFGVRALAAAWHISELEGME